MRKDDFSLARSELLVLTNTVPEGAELYGILFYGRAQTDVVPLYPFVAACFEKYRCPILINGSDGRRHDGTVPRESWPGGEEYRAQLVARGVPSSAILEAEPAHNTSTETESFLKLLGGDARTCAGKNLAIVAHPHQLLRIMATLIQKLGTHADSWPRIYSLYPSKTRWFETVAGSQGENGDIARIDHADLEVRRVLNYQRRDCADYWQLEAYFRWLETETS
ncbi:MAG: hypothetical protein WC866_02770 [Patescibacteria group bacterium]